MSATDAPRRKPKPIEMRLLLGFHALMSGSFLVAYLSGGEDSYGIHVFAGYTVLAALAARLVMALVAPKDSPLRLPRPSLSAVGDWLARLLRLDGAAFRARSPLLAFIAVAMLIGTAGAAVTGAVADWVQPVEDLHEALGDFALMLALVHVALAFGLAGLKRVAPAPRTREVLP